MHRVCGCMGPGIKDKGQLACMYLHTSYTGLSCVYSGEICYLGYQMLRRLMGLERTAKEMRAAFNERHSESLNIAEEHWMEARVSTLSRGMSSRSPVGCQLLNVSLLLDCRDLQGTLPVGTDRDGD